MEEFKVQKRTAMRTRSCSLEFATKESILSRVSHAVLQDVAVTRKCKSKIDSALLDHLTLWQFKNVGFGIRFQFRPSLSFCLFWLSYPPYVDCIPVSSSHLSGFSWISPVEPIGLYSFKPRLDLYLTSYLFAIEVTQVWTAWERCWTDV